MENKRSISLFICILFICCSKILLSQNNLSGGESFYWVTESLENENLPLPLKIRIANLESAIGKSYNWEKSSPKKQGLDTKILKSAYNEVKSKPYINSLVIIKNGYLVKEEYFNGGDRNTLDLTYSVTKSIISALIGIAIDKGYIKGLDQKIMDFYPEYNTPNLDSRKKDITIRHILTMQAGFDHENNISKKMISAPNMIKAIINSELKFDPGTDYLYSTSGSHLLSGIITKATQMSTKDFAIKYLFKPLDIKSVIWTTDQNGIYTGGAGLFLTPRDMARFGYLYLQKGQLNEQQIISAEWIKISTQNHRSYTETWNEMTNLG